MQNNDYNIIKPVENLQNVGAMRPIDRQAERRRRQSQREQRRKAASQQDLSNVHEDETNGSSDNQTGQRSIDYRA
jgi:hypothetical protein